MTENEYRERKEQLYEVAEEIADVARCFYEKDEIFIDYMYKDDPTKCYQQHLCNARLRQDELEDLIRDFDELLTNLEDEVEGES